MGTVGVEPTTSSLSEKRSTAELRAQVPKLLKFLICLPAGRDAIVKILLTILSTQHFLKVLGKGFCR